jgi:hypothetical protein
MWTHFGSGALTEQFADTIHYAITMPTEERCLRMKTMQNIMKDHNVYRWAGSMLTCLAATRSREPRSPEAGAGNHVPATNGVTSAAGTKGAQCL